MSRFMEAIGGVRNFFPAPPDRGNPTRVTFLRGSGESADSFRRTQVSEGNRVSVNTAASDMADIPTLTTPQGIARRADLNRLSVLRVVNNQLVRPDAWLERGEDGARVPLFTPERAVEILRHIRTDGRRRPIAGQAGNAAHNSG